MSVPVTISVCQPSEWARALWLLQQDLDETARVAQIAQLLARADETPEFFAGLFVAHDSKQLQGCVWLQELTGGVGVLWLPRLAANVGTKVAQELIDATRSFGYSRKLRFIQAVVTFPCVSDSQLLEEVEFEELAMLDYMACDTDAATAPPPLGQFNLTPFQPQQREELSTLIEATYEETLDCPEMDDVRSLDEILSGYEATGNSGTSHWFVARENELPVACLLLADHGNGDFELVYVGVARSARGRQLGALLTSFALFVANSHDAHRLLLAVDSRNHPAIRIYEQLGFEVLSRREVWMWQPGIDS